MNEADVEMSSSSEDLTTSGEDMPNVDDNEDIEAWRQVHAHLVRAVLTAREAIQAKKAQRRFWMEEICANLDEDGHLVANSLWKRPRKASAAKKVTSPAAKKRKRPSLEAKKPKAKAEKRKPTPQKKLRLKLSATAAQEAAEQANAELEDDESGSEEPNNYDNEEEEDEEEGEEEEEDEEEEGATTAHEYGDDEDAEYYGENYHREPQHGLPHHYSTHHDYHPGGAHWGPPVHPYMHASPAPYPPPGYHHPASHHHPDPAYPGYYPGSGGAHHYPSFPGLAEVGHGGRPRADSGSDESDGGPTF